jgi:hypothetical protein
VTKAVAFSLMAFFSFTQQIPRSRASLRFNSLGSFKRKNTKLLKSSSVFFSSKTNYETPLITIPTNCNSTNKNTTNMPHGIWVKLPHKWIHVQNTKLQTTCTKTTNLVIAQNNLPHFWGFKIWFIYNKKKIQAQKIQSKA